MKSISWTLSESPATIPLPWVYKYEHGSQMTCSPLVRASRNFYLLNLYVLFIPFLQSIHIRRFSIGLCIGTRRKWLISLVEWVELLWWQAFRKLKVASYQEYHWERHPIRHSLRLGMLLKFHLVISLYFLFIGYLLNSRQENVWSSPWCNRCQHPGFNRSL